tara:strand:- start:6461 stop:7123 length:663 start_codon:yes stop_codon:yes gene_type:complete
MKKLVLCGCSLGGSWMPYFDGHKRKHDSKPDNSYELGNWEKITRIQQSGGTHGLMLYRLLNHFLVNEIKDTTIVVQLTGYQRPCNVNQYHTEEDKSYEINTFQNNITDRDEFIICGNQTSPLKHLSGEADTECLISTICMLSKLGAKVYVFRGWPGICLPEEWNRTNAMLKDAGVITTELDYLTLAYNSTTDNWLDDKHPGVKLGCETFDKIWKAMSVHK